MASAALLLWLNRGGAFFIDEVIWFSDLGGENDLASILVPHNSHLHGTIRAIVLLTMELVGPQYIVFRVLSVISVLLCAGLFFALAKRRVGPIAALVPAVLLLFYGSAWQHVVVPIGFTVLFSIAAGLAALLALERDDRRGDVIACAAVGLSVFTFTAGLGFLVGVAISVLLRADRLRRAWIFAVPLALYTSWWLWAQQFGEGRTEASQIVDVLPFVARSVALTTGSLTGLNLSLDGLGDGSIVQEPPGLGWISAAALVAFLLWRFRRGSVPNSIYVSLGVVLTYWLAATFADTFEAGSQVYQTRYVFPGSVGVLLVITDAARGLRIGRPAIVGLLVVGAFSLAVNLVFLRDGAATFREDFSPDVQSRLAMFELGAGFDPGSDTGEDLANIRLAFPPTIATRFQLNGGGYLTAVSRYGSPAFTLEELRAQSVDRRTVADGVLAGVLGLAIDPSAGPAERSGCEVVRPPGEVALPPGGAYLRPGGPDAAVLNLYRFGDGPGPAMGTLPGDRWSVLVIPPDRAPEPWSASTSSGAPLTICPLE